MKSEILITEGMAWPGQPVLTNGKHSYVYIAFMSLGRSRGGEGHARLYWTTNDARKDKVPKNGYF